MSTEAGHLREEREVKERQGVCGEEARTRDRTKANRWTLCAVLPQANPPEDCLLGVMTAMIDVSPLRTQLLNFSKGSAESTSINFNSIHSTLRPHFGGQAEEERGIIQMPRKNAREARL